MHSYRVHTVASAPDKSKSALETLKRNFGLIPNLAATMAESPALLNGFVGLFAAFHGDGTLTNAQRQVLLLTNAVTNACPWAVAFHSTLALREGVSSRDVQALRERRLPEDRKLAALSALTRALIEKRGHIDERELSSFADAGLTPDHAFEVIAGIALSAMANYAGNIARPPVDEPFQAQAWQE